MLKHQTEADLFQAALDEMCAASQECEAALWKGENLRFALALRRLEAAQKGVEGARVALVAMILQCRKLDALLDEGGHDGR